MILLHFISTMFINVKLYIFFTLICFMGNIIYIQLYLILVKKKKDCARMSVIAYALKHAI